MPELASHGDVERAQASVSRTRRERLLTRAQGRIGGVPAAVWAITACYLGLLVCYSLLYPVYLGFDEPQHVDMTIALRHDPLSWPDPGERSLSMAVARTQGIVYSRGRPRITQSYLASEIPPRHARKTIQQLGDNAPVATPPALPNQMVQHPPLYYAVGAAALDVLPFSESLAYDQVVSILRLISVLMIAPLPLLVWGTTRRLVGAGPVAVASSALPLAVPGLARGAANYQNDNLLILLAAILTLLLAKVMTGDTSRRTAIGVGAAMSLALLTKGTALPLVPLVPAAYAVAWWRARGRAPLASAAIACAVSGIGALWWVRNLVLYRTVQVNGYGAQVAAQLDSKGRNPGTWWHYFKPQFVPRFWSGLGLLDQNGLHAGTVRLLTVVALIGVILAVIRGLGHGRGDRPTVVVLVLPLLLISALIVYGTWTYFERTGIPAGIQGRYAYPGVAGLAVVVAIGYGRAAGRFATYLPNATLLGALAVQVIAVRGVFFGLWLPRPWTGGGRADRYRVAFDNLAAWSPWPVGVTYAAFALAGLLVAAAVAVVVLRSMVTALPRRRTAPEAIA
jgi:4-amino-4-deoxy-L-arabinose transferase-like glycosyltransferase